MLLVRTRAELADALSAFRQNGVPRHAFVPTMGALHEGHLELVRAALRDHDHVVASVFVNPTQFDRADDLARYPRQPERDTELLAGAGAEVLWLPDVADVYPDGTTPARATPDLAGLDTRYEGARRPGHFDGVVQVVRRLVEAVRPAALYLGQKDAQQVAVLRRAAAQEFWPLTIVEVPTIREPSGLARSSRNELLSPEHRSRAAELYAALQAMAAGWSSGRAVGQLQAAALARLTAAGFEVEYADLVDAATFEPLPADASRATVHAPARIVAAAWLGGVRLIDNVGVG